MTIRKRGSSWQAIVKVTVDGTHFEESRSFETERLAKEWKSKMMAVLKVNGIPQRTKSTMTLGQLLSDYKETVSAVKPMRRQMVWEMDQLAGEFAQVKLNALNAKLFVDWGSKRFRSGTSAATVMHNLSTIRSCLNGAKPVLGVDVNGDSVQEALSALQRIGAAAKGKSRTRRPTDQEIEKLVAEFVRIGNHPSTIIPMDTIVKLAIVLPRRLGELTSMLWEDYRGTELILRETKNPIAPRTECIPVPPAAAEIINSLPKIDARILPYNSESVSASFERACKRLGIVDLRFHDLRHEGITRLFSQGLGIQEVALISGHQSWTMLKRYTHIQPREVLEKLNAHK